MQYPPWRSILTGSFLSFILYSIRIQWHFWTVLNKYFLITNNIDKEGNCWKCIPLPTSSLDMTSLHYAWFKLVSIYTSKENIMQLKQKQAWLDMTWCHIQVGNEKKYSNPSDFTQTLSFSLSHIRAQWANKLNINYHKL